MRRPQGRGAYDAPRGRTRPPLGPHRGDQAGRPPGATRRRDRPRTPRRLGPAPVVWAKGAEAVGAARRPIGSMAPGSSRRFYPGAPEARVCKRGRWREEGECDARTLDARENDSDGADPRAPAMDCRRPREKVGSGRGTPPRVAARLAFSAGSASVEHATQNTVDSPHHDRITRRLEPPHVLAELALNAAPTADVARRPPARPRAGLSWPPVRGVPAAQAMSRGASARSQPTQMCLAPRASPASPPGCAACRDVLLAGCGSILPSPPIVFNSGPPSPTVSARPPDVDT